MTQRAAVADSTTASHQAITSLQRAHGNQAVQRLVSERVQRRAPTGAQGGEVDAGLQHDITAARGGGKPLNGTVSAQLGGALKAYVGQGLREDLALLESKSEVSRLIASLRKQGIKEDALEKAMTEAGLVTD